MNVRSLDRVPIRTRESGVTQSAWQMEVETDDGIGTITLIESGGSTVWRGGGALLGWPQEQLEATYRELLEARQKDVEPPIEFPQLG